MVRLVDLFHCYLLRFRRSVSEIEGLMGMFEIELYNKYRLLTPSKININGKV